MKVIIAGGGIGGLATALMLKARNINVRVYESAAHIREAGVGINILPHAIRELEALGLLGALDKVGLRTRSLTYFTKSGQEVWSELRGTHAGRYARGIASVDANGGTTSSANSLSFRALWKIDMPCQLRSQQAGRRRVTLNDGRTCALQAAKKCGSGGRAS